jgi:inosine-uridine nucleoside N-ribohydrolase
VGFIVETCRSTEGLWIVATGPLTNVALALRVAPGIAERVAGISIMGGGSFGNRSAMAEFNIWADPEAAAIVFEASPFGGRPLVMAGLDVTHRFVATPQRIDAVGRAGGLLATTLADLLRFFTGTYLERTEPGAIGGAPMHDVLAVLAITHPDLFERAARHVVVEMTGVHTRGMTVVDQRQLRERPAPNVEVLTAVDDAAAFDVLLDAITAASGPADSG